jgi:hypothetical protein
MARRRTREFESFVGGAAGRLLHVAVLLTGEPADAAPQAQRLLTAALANTYADWELLRGEDPYDRTRQELALLFAQSAWYRRRRTDGVLGLLSPRERVVLVLRMYEGVGETQTAALLGLSEERVRTCCGRAAAIIRDALRKERAGGSPAWPGRRPPAGNDPTGKGVPGSGPVNTSPKSGSRGPRTNSGAGETSGPPAQEPSGPGRPAHATTHPGGSTP